MSPFSGSSIARHRPTGLDEVGITASQSPITLVTPCMQAVRIDGRDDRAVGFLHVPAVLEAARARQPFDLRKTQRTCVELVDGRSEIAHSGRVHERAPEIQVVRARGRGGVTTFLLAHQLTGDYLG